MFLSISRGPASDNKLKLITIPMIQSTLSIPRSDYHHPAPLESNCRVKRSHRGNPGTVNLTISSTTPSPFGFAGVVNLGKRLGIHNAMRTDRVLSSRAKTHIVLYDKVSRPMYTYNGVRKRIFQRKSPQGERSFSPPHDMAYMEVALALR